MGEELEISMSDQYKEITDAVEKYASKQHLASYDTGYSTGYNRAIEDAINILPEMLPNIEMIKLNMRKLKA